MAQTPTSWQKGQSGNPKGRPKKGYSITESMREMLNSNPESVKKICRSLIGYAEDGEIAAIKLIWSYMDGLPERKNESSDQPHPIPILGINHDQLEQLVIVTSSDEVCQEQNNNNNHTLKVT